MNLVMAEIKSDDFICKENGIFLIEAIHQKIAFLAKQKSYLNLIGLDNDGQKLVNNHHAHLHIIPLFNGDYVNKILFFAGYNNKQFLTDEIELLSKIEAKIGFNKYNLTNVTEYKLNKSNKFISYTPYSPARFLKVAKNASKEEYTLKLLEHLNIEMQERLLPNIKQIQIKQGNEYSSTNFSKFATIRTKDIPSKKRQFMPKYALELLLDSETDVPICLGYASHYGLGSFL